MRPIRRLLGKSARALASWALYPVLRREEKQERLRRVNERPIEYAFALHWLARSTARDVLDIGTGQAAWPRVLADCGFQVRAIDQGGSYWSGGLFNRHFLVRADDITCPTTDRKFDFITCISVLEHIVDHTAAILGMYGLLRPTGRLVLTCPYNEREFVENVYLLPGAGYGRSAPYICRVYSRREVDRWIEATGANLLQQELYTAFSGELWTFGERLVPPRLSSPSEPHHLTCIVLEKPASPKPSRTDAMSGA